MRFLTTLILTFCSFNINAQIDFDPAQLAKENVDISLGKSQDTLLNQAMENIKNSYPQNKKLDENPEGFHPDNGLWGNTGMRSDYRVSLEEKNYDLSEQPVTSDNSISIVDNNSKIQEEYLNPKKTTFLEKFINIIALVILWFLLGFLINFFFYAGKPDYMLGKSKSAKNAHILINICTIVIILYTIFK